MSRTHDAAVQLARDLRRTIRGEVRFDDGSRALYATDASNYRQLPIGVVVPRDVDDAVAALAEVRRYGLPVLPRGGGTSLAGQCCNAAVVFDFTKSVNRLLALDPEHRVARVEPGLVLDDLRAAAERHHLTFGPDPSTHNHCALGGMIGNNSCGVHSVMAGRTSDNVLALDVLTYDGLRLHVGPTDDAELDRLTRDGGRRGEIYRRLQRLRDRYAGLIRERFPKIPRRVSGYALDELLPENGFHVARALCGSEGTCVTVLGATLRLVASPPARTLLVLGYPDVFQAGDDVPAVLEAGPIGLEGMDDRLEQAIRRAGLHAAQSRRLPEGRGWLLAEFGGDTAEAAEGEARRLMAHLGRREVPPTMKLVRDREDQQAIWTIREAGLGATARVPGDADTWEGWEDSAVPIERLGEYLRRLRALLDRYGYGGALYGHFGQGCVHTRIDFDLLSRPGIAKFRSFVETAADLVIAFGGSLSGEHGDGQARGELLARMYGPELVAAFREFKAIWDPAGRMNPGKVVDALPLDAHLRLGTDYRPPSPATHFAFGGEDRGSFARATLRCVGVGECRRTAGGLMCPSYMVTREEQHSTRGRARLLFEMLEGDAITGGWRDPHVKEALDLCFACKGCKTECPVGVDMATYKAEFLSHYYAGRLRPRHAYAFGLIFRWARLAAWAPGLANRVARTPGVARLVKGLVGMAPERQIPTFAPETFVRWFRRRGIQNTGGSPVLLWPDTFTNHFHPETAQAAVEVLEAAGFRVTVPAGALCCGRPLYDYGMLARAKRMLAEILEALRPQIAAGTPVIGLEPSCVAVFRDELPGLFPHDQDARRLSRQVWLLSEFFEREASDWAPAALEHRALVHLHCHHRAVLGVDAERAILARLGLDAEILDTGCCGMAGSFGFEKDKYGVSMKAAERVLLPAIRRASPDTLLIADGFSCREQIAQATGRRALHLA
ncbi:MAG: FAD-binding and (Fe-S)-binding domain-containing protein, partial [Candidatus Rokuibacteriota bacterium]